MIDFVKVTISHFPVTVLASLMSRFVGFAAGRQQHDPGQVRRLLRQRLGKADDGLGDHGRVEVVERAGGVPDRGDDFRMAVARIALIWPDVKSSMRAPLAS